MSSILSIELYHAIALPAYSYNVNVNVNVNQSHLQRRISFLYSVRI